jgi:hypothetical protein
MRRINFIALLLITTALLGCSSATQFTNLPMIQYDDDTEYAVEQTANGFNIYVNYSRHQYFPETNIVVASCKSALTSIAYEYADQKGRQIMPINEQRIKISTGRNGMSGMTSCSSMAVIEWQ